MRAGLFPGQGIAPKLLLQSLDPLHPTVEAASEALGFDLFRRIQQVSRGSRPVLPTTLAQPGIFVAGVIAYRDAQTRGESFDCLLGHSLGEYTALTAGGAIPFAHALRLIRARAETMHRAAGAGAGGMAAVMGLGPETVERIAHAHGLEVANDNSPSQTVVSGATDALARAAKDVRGAGGRSILLDVEGAFHSSAMEPAVAELADALMATEVRAPSIPVISNVSARPYRAPGEIRKLLLGQLTGRVRFRESVLYLIERGVTEFRDLGPGDVVARLAGATFRSAKEVVGAAHE